MKDDLHQQLYLKTCRIYPHKVGVITERISCTIIALTLTQIDYIFTNWSRTRFLYFHYIAPAVILLTFHLSLPHLLFVDWIWFPLFNIYIILSYLRHNQCHKLVNLPDLYRFKPSSHHDSNLLHHNTKILFF